MASVPLPSAAEVDVTRWRRACSYASMSWLEIKSRDGLRGS